MADIHWPSSLPYFDLGWSMSPSDSILRSQPERGPAKTRRKTSAKTLGYSGTITLTSSQLDAFMEFVEEAIMDTALPFLYPDYIRNEERLARITSYSITQENRTLYTVDIELEVLP